MLLWTSLLLLSVLGAATAGDCQDSTKVIVNFSVRLRSARVINFPGDHSLGLMTMIPAKRKAVDAETGAIYAPVD
jgi:hypothetical protein